MYRKIEFRNALEAIRYLREKHITNRSLMYIASKGNACELVYKI